MAAPLPSRSRAGGGAHGGGQVSGEVDDFRSPRAERHQELRGLAGARRQIGRRWAQALVVGVRIGHLRACHGRSPSGVMKQAERLEPELLAKRVIIKGCTLELTRLEAKPLVSSYVT